MNAKTGADTSADTDRLVTDKYADLVSELINTYRELNMRVRPLPEDKLTTGGEGSIHAIVAQMRLDEMNFAQALKQRVTGVVIGNPNEDQRLLPTNNTDHSTVMLISQFGNARETTLSLLGDLTDADWTTRTDDGESLLDHVRALAKNDQTQLQRINQLLG